MTNNICKTIYINLKKRTDRREFIENELNRYQLDWERFEAIETPTSGILGCCISHLMVLQIAKERNYENILILEDDFTFLVSKEELDSYLKEFFMLKLNYDVCMLSYNVQQYSEIPGINIVNKVVEAQTASGYIVNKHYYDKLINILKFTIPLLYQTKQHWLYANDQIWKSLQLTDNWVYFKQRIGKQRFGYSDNSESYCELDY
jgi:GR25 family glycosyltransferase involved in LPS biosynthesis